MTKHAAILCLAAVAAPAAADDHAPSPLHMRDASAGDDGAPAAEDNGKTEVISVTDTTVEHERLTGRAPVSVVTRDDLIASGRAMLGDILQALPAQANAGNAQVNAGGDGTTRITRALGGDARYEVGEHEPPEVASAGYTTDNEAHDTLGKFHLFEGFGELAIVPFTNLAAASRDVDRYVKLDLFGGYDLPSWLGKTTLQVGINNVFDATPPVVYNAPAANSDATIYDFVGRMVYLRLSQLF